jgi:hypothetical protein
MKKRAAAKKPAAPKSAAKKTTTTKASKAEKPARMQEQGAGKYTPTPIQGIGWAPFRYPA